MGYGVETLSRLQQEDRSVAASPGILIAGNAYENGVRLLQLGTLQLPAGQWSVLLGSSGVGKSSLLRLIAGLPTHLH